MELSRRDLLKVGLFSSAALMLPAERVARTKLAIANRLPQSKLPAPFTMGWKTPLPAPKVSVGGSPPLTAGGDAVELHGATGRERHPEDRRCSPDGVRTLRDSRNSDGESTHRKVASCALRCRGRVSDLTYPPGSRPPRPALKTRRET